MRPILLLLAVLPIFVGCLPQTMPTRVDVVQYPATWTPAPTPTGTPLPPTATLVIQRTPGRFPTAMPNARAMPNVPGTGIGFWLELTAQTPRTLESVVTRASVLATDGTGNIPKGSAFVFLTGVSPSASKPLAPLYNGVIISSSDKETWKAAKDSIAPRLLLVSTVVTDTATLASVGSASDGVRLENFLREPTARADGFPTEAEWQRDVAALEALSGNPNLVMLTSTRLDIGPEDKAPPADKWLDYALASFLMGTHNSHAFFGFETANNPQVMDAPILKVRLGTPLGGASKQNGVYQRRFSRGLVLVNPGSEDHAFALSRNYVDSDGAQLNQVYMPPHSGMILLNAE